MHETLEQIELDAALYCSPRGNTSFEYLAYNLELTLPTVGRILDLGSGLCTLFQRQVARTVPALQIIGIDPNLIDDEYRYQYLHDELEDESLAPKSEVTTIAALAQSLPFKSNLFDIVISHAAVPTYLPLEPKDLSIATFQRTFEEILRVLKPGGVAKLGPMDEYHALRSDMLLERSCTRFEIHEIEKLPYATVAIPWFRLDMWSE